MGIYSGDSFFQSSIRNIEPAEGYDDGAVSAQIALIETCQNQFALFEGTIRNDIQEANMRIGGADEEEILTFSENALTSLLGKIKEMIKKLWAKIKGIFKGFMARLEATFGKNNKEFVEKYKNVVLGKDLSDFEPKYRKVKHANTVIPAFNETGIEEKLSTSHALSQDPVKKMENWDEETEADDLCHKCIDNSINWKDFEKEFMEYCFDDESEDKISIHTVMSELIGFKTLKKGAKTANDSLDKAMSKLIKQIEKDEDTVTKNFPEVKETITAKKYGIQKSGDKFESKESEDDDAGKWDGSTASKTVTTPGSAGAPNKVTDDNHPLAKYQKALQLVSKYAHLYQNVATKYTQCSIKALNFYNKQNRTIWAKAVAYNRKKNEEVMMEAMAELAEWEADY